MAKPDPIYCAIDTGDLDAAETLAKSIAPHVGGLKLGLQFFVAHGRAGVQRLADHGLPIFLDLKFHDIPNTVAKAIESTAGLPVRMLTIHASGGPEMLKRANDAAKNVAARTGQPAPLVIAVTVLTSLDATDLAAVGQPADAAAQVLRLAELVQKQGVDGVVCSPQEIASIRATCGPGFHLVVPGIRPVGSAVGDQKRTMTPAEALRLGADTLVIGRPITDAAQPADAAKMIADNLR